MDTGYTFADFAREHGIDPNDVEDEGYIEDSGIGLYSQPTSDGYEGNYEDYVGEYMRFQIPLTM